MQVKVGQSAFWNSWVTADGTAEPVAAVKSGARYVVSFDSLTVRLRIKRRRRRERDPGSDISR